MDILDDPINFLFLHLGVDSSDERKILRLGISRSAAMVVDDRIANASAIKGEETKLWTSAPCLDSSLLLPLKIQARHAIIEFFFPMRRLFCNSSYTL